MPPKVVPRYPFAFERRSFEPSSLLSTAPFFLFLPLEALDAPRPSLARTALGYDMGVLPRILTCLSLLMRNGVACFSSNMLGSSVVEEQARALTRADGTGWPLLCISPVAFNDGLIRDVLLLCALWWLMPTITSDSFVICPDLINDRLYASCMFIDLFCIDFLIICCCWTSGLPFLSFALLELVLFLELCLGLLLL